MGVMLLNDAIVWSRIDSTFSAYRSIGHFHPSTLDTSLSVTSAMSLLKRMAAIARFSKASTSPKASDLSAAF
jgi:hypothetical protein